ncbi:MAG: adenosine kinase [Rhodobacter sp.]|uniref:adenosine kinase n=1 Tax=Pararhodobacter sp. TaxID=2127056 RepID=UPI001DA1C54D|nr:adenosine kinase [Pararhodobacter sp.]MCB1346332.1 adenosine kinase [Paracoccaceae bacterium]MCC0072456.1 adenosine kinase [Rhodobacter sp.]HPD91286.1 adenosine kinase [Pararhodobacter sp.]
MKRYQVAGIGNAIVDVISTVNDHFLDHMGIHKGIMQLIERERAETLYGAMKDRQEASGGSVCNTIAGIGALGLKTALVGRVRDDSLGRFFAQDTERAGTAFVNPPVTGGELPTSRSMIFVTPDGERSMNTYLGISAEVGPDDVDERVMADSGIVFLEGYLFDKDKGKEAFLKAARACHKGGGRVGIALSDPFCVDRHRADFRRLVAEDMDYVIGNEKELTSLYEENDLDDALARAAQECGIVVCTRSGDPVVLIQNGRRVEAPVRSVTPVDATGAGDQFAAGFLYGLATGQSLETCGRMGNIAAAEVIGHIGARPRADVLALFRAEGLL